MKNNLQLEILKNVLFLKKALLETSIYKNQFKHKDTYIQRINICINEIKQGKGITEGTLKNSKVALRTYPKDILLKIKCTHNIN